MSHSGHLSVCALFRSFLSVPFRSLCVPFRSFLRLCPSQVTFVFVSHAGHSCVPIRSSLCPIQIVSVLVSHSDPLCVCVSCRSSFCLCSILVISLFASLAGHLCVRVPLSLYMCLCDCVCVRFTSSMSHSSHPERARTSVEELESTSTFYITHS